MAYCGASVAENCTYFESSGSEIGLKYMFANEKSACCALSDLSTINAKYFSIGACSLEICPCSSGNMTISNALT